MTIIRNSYAYVGALALAVLATPAFAQTGPTINTFGFDPQEHVTAFATKAAGVLGAIILAAFGLLVIGYVYRMVRRFLKPAS